MYTIVPQLIQGYWGRIANCTADLFAKAADHIWGAELRQVEVTNEDQESAAAGAEKAEVQSRFYCPSTSRDQSIKLRRIDITGILYLKGLVAPGAKSQSQTES